MIRFGLPNKPAGAFAPRWLRHSGDVMAFADGHDFGVTASLGGHSFPVEQMRARRKLLLIVAGAIFSLAAVAIAVRWWLAEASYISTDDAYVGASLAEITPQIEGAVGQVLVTDTQHVKRGDLLVVLDQDDMSLAVQQAQAQYQKAVQRVEQYQVNVSGGVADVMSKEAALKRAKLALDRRTRAAASGGISSEELSDARTSFDRAGFDLSAARQNLASLQILVKQAHVDMNPEVLSYKVALDAALLNLRRTEIRAPVAGIVAQLHVQVGQRVRVGGSLMSIVPIMEAHVDANFKEGQIEGLRLGQPVSLTSDLYGPQIVFHGQIEGIGGGTGAALAIIPAQNATGNWIKVVQRLPVRISLNSSELAKHPLRVGLSMNATVDTRAPLSEKMPSIRTVDASAPY